MYILCCECATSEPFCVRHPKSSSATIFFFARVNLIDMMRLPCNANFPMVVQSLYYVYLSATSQ